jgi:hypothetical protein
LTYLTQSYIHSAKNATNDLKIANAKKWETIAT